MAGDTPRTTLTPAWMRRWEYRLVGDKWIFSELTDPSYAAPTRVQDETITLNPAGTERTTVRRVLEGSGTEAARETTVEILTARGWQVSQFSRGIDAPEQRSYNAQGRLTQVVDAYGHWSKYEYNTDGSVSRVVTQHQANALSTPDNQNSVTELQTIIENDIDGDGIATDVLRATTRYLLGAAVERSMEVWCPPSPFRGTSLPYCHSSYTRSFTIQCADLAIPNWNPLTHARGLVYQTAAWRTGFDRVSMRDQEGQLRADIWQWKTPTALVQGSDGRATFAMLSPDYTNRIETTETWSGTYDPNALHEVRAESRTVSIRRTDLGVTPRQESFDMTSAGSGDGVRVSGTLVEMFDGLGRATLTRHWTVTEQPASDPNATSETRVYGCCGLESQTDEDGITTSYGYDELGRMIWTQSPLDANRSIRMGTVYDAAGSVRTETRTPYTGTTPGALGSVEHRKGNAQRALSGTFRRWPRAIVHGPGCSAGAVVELTRTTG